MAKSDTNYLVTIGIPMYQVENYIRRTLESVLSQTYPNIEFLIIDDCSTDSSLEIVKSFQTNHSRGGDIRIIAHNENLGVSETRNHIIDEAKGDYLYFVDSDDIISQDAISLLVQQIELHNADAAFGSYEKVDISGERSFFSYPMSVFDEDNTFANFVFKKYAGFQASACNYLMNIDLLRRYNLRFFKADFWEDMVFTLCFASYVQRVVLLPNITYTYQCREKSLSKKWGEEDIPKKCIMQYFNAIECLKDEAVKQKTKPYFPQMCYFAIISDIYIICNILKKWNSIRPPFSKHELDVFLCHPSSFAVIMSFNQMRIANMVLFLFSKFPISWRLFFIHLFAKYKRLL